MEIGNHRFTPRSITLLMISVILFPLTINIFWNSYDNMQYYQNLSQSIVLHHSKNYGEAQFYLRKALEIKPGEADAMALLGKTLLLKGKTKEALKVYKDIAEYGFNEERVTGEIGVVVCSLYENEQTIQSKDLNLYRSANDKLKLLATDYPEITDIPICRGHLYLLQAIFYKKNNDKKKELSYAKLAEEEFRKAINNSQSPPSSMSITSVYFGLGVISHWQSEYLLEKTPQPKRGSSDAKRILQKSIEANEYFFKAQLYRMSQYPNILMNTVRTFDKILSFPWLTEKQRKKTAERAEQYLADMQLFQRYLRTEISTARKINQIWKINDSNAYVHNGLGFYFLEQKLYRKAEKSFAKALERKVPKSNIGFTYARTKRIESTRKTAQFQVDLARGFAKDYSINVAKILKSSSFTKSETKYITNFLAALHFAKTFTRGIAKIVEDIEKKMSSFPDEIVEIDDKQISVIKVMKHNLYHLYSIQRKPELKKRAKKYKQFKISD